MAAFGPNLSLQTFNEARQGIRTSTIMPPFHFKGVVAKVFPLRANLTRLQIFLDAYLNIVPPEVGEFRAFMPYVYLTVIHYGKMSLDAANLGWIAQNEVLFNVPLLWYKKTPRGFVFHDYASVSPFIYVDNESSMTTGRQVFGWPKDLVSADRLLGSWASEPEARSVLLRFNAEVIPEFFVGERMASKPLFEIDHAEGSSFMRLPFNPRAAWLPWVGLPDAIAGSVDMMRDYAEMLRGLRSLRSRPGVAPDAYAGMLARLMQSIRQYSSGGTFNTINLKQFRDAEEPNFACYQAITNAPMRWTRILRAGPLGERQVFQGDPSGGYSVHVHHYPATPIVETLGLEVASERSLGKATVHTLRPVLPLWMEADLCYNLGSTIAWRTREREDAKGGEDAKGRVDVWRDAQGKELEPHERSVQCRYNTARGAAEAEVSGPFDYPDVTVRVMPLLACEEKLEAFLNDLMCEPLKSVGRSIVEEILIEIEESERAAGATPPTAPPQGGQERHKGIEVLPWGRYVYLVAFSYEGVASDVNDIGSWTDRELLFYVPAQVRVNGKLWKIALVPAYGYANSVMSAVIGAEVSGIPCTKAALESSTNTWMNSAGPSVEATSTLLTARKIILPTAGMGQEASERTLLEVTASAPISKEDEDTWRYVAATWGQTLKSELKRKQDVQSNFDARLTDARAFAFQMITQKRPVHFLTLKQFRDTEHPTMACYSAFVQIAVQITRVHEIEEIETGLYVRLRQYPTEPIVNTLGLVCMSEVMSDGVLTHVLEPVRPFWMRISAREHLGRHLFVRAGSEAWRAPRTRAEDPASRVPWPSVEPLFMLPFHEPRWIIDLSQEYSSRFAATEPVTPARLEAVVASLDPQIVLESILSEEWERRGDSRWRSGLSEVEHQSSDQRTTDPVEVAKAELSALAGMLNPDLAPEEWSKGAREAIRLMATLFQHRLIIYYLQQLPVTDSTAKESLRERLIKEYQDTISKHTFSGALDDWTNIKGFTGSFDAAIETPPDTGWEFVRWSQSLIEKLRKPLLLFFSKAYQKPRFVIRRNMIANESVRDCAFPKNTYDISRFPKTSDNISRFWLDHWYKGK